MPRLLRATACLAAAALIAITGGVTTAGAASPAPLPNGLFGSGDPTYDGVYRQSLALLALHTSGYRPGAASLQWLRDQQCADGGFMAYRASPATPCVPAKEDTNSTSLAVQALATVGTLKGQDEKRRSAAIDWLKKVERPDGGFGYYPGNPSDSNSTGLALSAFVAVDEKPPTASDGKKPVDFLRTQQLGCSFPAAQQGAFAYQTKAGKRTANASATAQAVLGLLPEALPVEPMGSSTSVPSVTCPPSKTLSSEETLGWGEAYLDRTLGSHGNVIPSPTGGSTPDFGTTANAVLALAAGGVGKDQQSATVDYLSAHVDDWAKGPGGQDQAGPLATLVLVAYATGGNSRAFGGQDLVQRLRQTENGGVTSVHVATPKPQNDLNIGLIVFVLVAAGAVTTLIVLDRRRRGARQAATSRSGAENSA